MPRPPRLEEVPCAICWESLFAKRDDLDDLVTVATPDCGHVFHEPCILKWFQAQSEKYLAAAREQGIDGRHGSPSLSDAPAECPTCRTECFADPETGEPTIHRLFIDFGENGGSSSQALGSSPVKAIGDKGTEREVLGLARRAKGVGEEVRGLGAQSAEEDLEGMMKRADGLVEDLVSVKALKGVKTYVISLREAIEDLRYTLQTHPLIPTLQHRITQIEQDRRQLEERMRTALPREVKKAVEAERTKLERKVKQAEKDCQVLQQELAKEQTARRRGKQAMEEKEQDMTRQLRDKDGQLDKERTERERLQGELHERNKQLKQLRASAESRKSLKAQLAELQAENERLKGKASASGSQRRRAVKSDDEIVDADRSVQEILGRLFRDKPNPYKHSSEQEDDYEHDSLQVDMPSFADDSLRGLSRLTQAGPSRPRPRPHPTARTYQFDIDMDKKKRKSSTSKYFEDKNKENRSIRSPEYQYGLRDGDNPRGRGEVMVAASSSPCSVFGRDWNATSGYDYRNDDAEDEDGYGYANPEAEAGTHPSPPKKSKTNPYLSTKHATEKRKALPVPALLGEAQNVVAHETRRTSPRRPKEKANPAPDDREVEVINLASSDSETKGASEPFPFRFRPPFEKNRNKSGSRSVVDTLVDRNGRPAKGVVGGQRVKRRA